MQLVKVRYCKLPIIGKKLPSFQHICTRKILNIIQEFLGIPENRVIAIWIVLEAFFAKNNFVRMFTTSCKSVTHDAVLKNSRYKRLFRKWVLFTL